MAKTIEQLKAQSAEIKNATAVGENTATRVGTLFNDIVDFEAEQIQTGRIANGAVTGDKIAAGTITEDNIADKSLSQKVLANNAVNTDIIQDGVVTIKKLADNAFDEEPTAGSDNLVKSGGVFSTLEHNGVVDIYFYTGKMIDTNASVGSVPSLEVYDLASYQYCDIKCQGGDKFKVSGTGGTSPRLWCFLNSNNEVLSIAADGESSTGKFIIAPEGAVRLICNNMNNGNLVVVTQTKQEIYDLQSKVKDIPTNPFVIADSSLDIDYGFLIDAWTNIKTLNKNIIKFTQLYNQNSYWSQIITIVDENNIKYIFRGNNKKKTGKEWVKIYNEEYPSTQHLYIMAYVDWDKMPEALEGISLYLRSNIIKYNELYDLNSQDVNYFINAIPKPFKRKIGSQDVLVVVQGDSIIGQVAASVEFDTEHAKILPPSCNYLHFCYQLFNRVVVNKPIFRRYDCSVFTYTGSWSTENSNLEDSAFDTPNVFGEFSQGALTHASQSTGSTVSFNVDMTPANERRTKMCLFFAKHTNGGKATITIGDGSSSYNGKLLCSEDRQTWVELNGYEYDCNSNRAGLTQEQAEAQGKTWNMRNMRLWVKAVGDLDNVDISTVYVLTITATESSSKVYFWGYSQWKGNTVHFDFVGRGGRDISILRKNMSDIADRKPDLLLLELPLANDRNRFNMSVLETLYTEGLLENDADTSYKKASNNYSDWQVLAILPPCRDEAWKGDEPVVFGSLTNSGMIDYDRYMTIYNLIANSDIEGLNIIDLMDALIKDGKQWFDTVEDVFNTGNYTYDGIHLNALGSSKWGKYISLCFNK